MALRGPQMLKDFLADDSNSCSFSGFRSFSRRSASIRFTRSRSIAAIYKASEILFSAFSSVKSPTVLPRSISRRRREKPSSGSRGGEVSTVSVVKVKDILRWTSFRDLAEERGKCDLTAEELPSWRGYFEECLRTEGSEECGPPEEDTVAGRSTLESKVRETQQGDYSSWEEKEQLSPVSVLNFPFQDEEDQPFSSFHHSLANLGGRNAVQHLNMGEATKLVEGGEEGIEEKARQLLDRVKEASPAELRVAHLDKLLLDFFFYELATSRDDQDQEGLESKILGVAKAWVSRPAKEPFRRRGEGEREACVREMDGGSRWCKLEEERREVAVEVEMELLEDLVDELLDDLQIS
ncbi:hypothetical protein NMG60_11029105 [Bertholletia excelsa]